ncbi:MAG TPA: hypothetical protein VHT34_11715 [Clostridia bacterium]|nr:hypothetical protein [Clostridia bacterium]
MKTKRIAVILTLALLVSVISVVSSASSVSSTSILPMPVTNVHNVVSEKPLYVKDGLTGTWYDNVKGKCVISWQDKTRYGFYNAKLTVYDPVAATNISYKFQLVSIANCNSDTIEGLFDIKKNGTLVASGVTGKLYGLNQAVDNYFKFYSTGEVWHMSAYITSRVDY